MKNIRLLLILFFAVLIIYSGFGQSKNEFYINQNFKNTLLQHKEFVSIPNLPENKALMLDNINWVANQYKALGFKTSQLSTGTIPILLAEKVFDPKLKTVLFYFHIDGQPVHPKSWNQEDPFDPVLKKRAKMKSGKQ